MKQTLITIATFGLVVAALAHAAAVGVFNSTYKIEKSSKLGKANCAVCHATAKGGKLNGYGKDIETAMGSSKKMTAAHLKAVEGKDSDGDGKSNIEEIKADSMPGTK